MAHELLLISVFLVFIKHAEANLKLDNIMNGPISLRG